MTTKVAVLGHGRMGKAVEMCISQADDLTVCGIWVRPCHNADQQHHSVHSSDLPTVLASADIAIDFTLADVAEDLINAVAHAKIPLVCGVSGLSASTLQIMTTAAETIPILHDRNMSLGVAVLQQMVHLAGAVLSKEFTAEIHETHHVDKIDAPSGTALQLGETLAAGRGQIFNEVIHYDPSGATSPAKGQIHFEVTRHGEVPGEHTILLKSANEHLSLTHKVDDRNVFATGAINATRWLLGQKPGLYCMQDLLPRT